MRRIIRALAVIALALSPVWGVPSVHAASSLAPAKYPYWPSFYSSGCSTTTGPFGGVTLSCGTGSYAATQITSAYGGCSQINIDVNSFGSGPFITSATAPVGGIQNTITINDTGHYYMQLSWVPSTTVGPIEIQFSAPDTGNMSLNNITVDPCPVATSTPTVNPSSTSTNTPIPVTGTSTPIPSNTPLPSGHNTFTATATPTGSPLPPTSTATATAGPSYRNCGDSTFPLLNCDALGGGGFSGGAQADFWTTSTAVCDNDGGSGPPYTVLTYTDIALASQASCSQSVTPTVSGTLFLRYQATGINLSANIIANGTTRAPSGTLTTASFGTVTAGTPVTVSLQVNNTDGAHAWWYIATAFVSSSSNTPTPVNTNTSTATATIVPGTSTRTFTPTLTPVPIPGAQETAIPTDTECPGGCAVQQLTAIPGMATIVRVDTSPFDPLKNLSLTRSTCAAFGYAQIPYPHVIGTPAYGSTNPISYTWTTDITGPWDNSIVNGSIVVTNTALQPCAMSEIPTFVWDLTYWLSVIVMAVGWFLWLIGFVGRLSGEETING